MKAVKAVRIYAYHTCINLARDVTGGCRTTVPWIFDDIISDTFGKTQSVGKTRFSLLSSMQLLAVDHLLKFLLNVQGVSISESEVRMKNHERNKQCGNHVETESSCTKSIR